MERGELLLPQTNQLTAAIEKEGLESGVVVVVVVGARGVGF